MGMRSLVHEKFSLDTIEFVSFHTMSTLNELSDLPLP